MHGGRVKNRVKVFLGLKTLENTRGFETRPVTVWL